MTEAERKVHLQLDITDRIKAAFDAARILLVYYDSDDASDDMLDRAVSYAREAFKK